MTKDRDRLAYGGYLNWCLKGKKSFKRKFDKMHDDTMNMVVDDAKDDYPEDELARVHSEVLKQYEEDESILKNIFSHSLDLTPETVKINNVPPKGQDSLKELE